MSGKGTALQEALQKWRVDQAKNQALQTQLADDKAKKRPRKESTRRTSKASPSPATSEAGTKDLRSQLKIVVRGKAIAVPLAKQIKDSLEALQRVQVPQTSEQLTKLTGHDCSQHTQLSDLLQKNPKVEYRDARYKFKAAADVTVKDRSGALRFIQSSKGCLVRDLAAAYPSAAQDVANLAKEGFVWLLPAAEKEQQAVFPRDKPPLVDTSEEVIKLWHQIEVSEDPEEQARELKRANITSAVQQGRRERPKVSKKDRKEKKKKTVNFDRFKKITNEHLPELFKGEAATSID